MNEWPRTIAGPACSDPYNAGLIRCQDAPVEAWLCQWLGLRVALSGRLGAANLRAVASPNRIARAGFAALLAGAGVVAATSLVAAADPQVTIEPGTELAAVAQEITVRGTGFDPEANGGVGLYVVFGPRTPAPTYYTDAELYIAARWVHPGAAEGAAGQALLAPDGTFTVTMTIEPRFVDGHDAEVDCLVDECVLITMAAHGVDDRTQDTFTPITFVEGAAASVSQDIPQVSVAPMSPAPSADAGEASPTPMLTLGGVAVVLAVAALGFVALRRRPRAAA